MRLAPVSRSGASRFVTTLMALSLVVLAAMQLRADDTERNVLRLKSKTMLEDMAPRSRAIYAQPTGTAMMRLDGYSTDNGETWEKMTPKPDFDSDLPYGYRRSPAIPWLDPVNGNVLLLLNCMDTPGKDPNAHEPRWQWQWYYLRYRVSTDGGRTYLFDEPIVQDGDQYSAKHPIDGVHIGQNCYFLGDSGNRPIRTRDGQILVPVQMPPLAPGGGLQNPGGGWYWLDTVILIGRWTDDNHLVWDVSEPIHGDGDRTARGLYEGTLAELPDGRVLCVMRGSNGGSKDRNYQWPSYKWCSTSTDGGKTWTDPKPWTYSSGENFYSPASMSMFFEHSSGRILWIGNVSDQNCRANHPRWPLVMGEVDPKTGGLIKESVITIDTKRPDEDDVNLSHWHAIEDRKTGDIHLPMSRASKGYKSRRPVLYVVDVKE